MKSILSALATTLLLSFSGASMAADAPAAPVAADAPAAPVVHGAKDCSKTTRPEQCEALKAAEEACKDKSAAERKACVKANLKANAPKK